MVPLEEGEDEDAKLKRVEEEALALLQSGTFFFVFITLQPRVE